MLYTSAIDEDQLTDRTIITNVRHYDSLLKTSEALDEVLHALDTGISKELFASDIRRMLNYLGQITGEVTNEDILEDIFSKFCIGK